MNPLKLSKRKVGDAQRFGGIELLVLWPEELGSEPSGIKPDRERDADPRERRHAIALAHDACRDHALTVVDVRVVNRHRVGSLSVAPGVHRIHLSIHLVGADWAAKTAAAGKRGAELFHETLGRPVGSGENRRGIELSLPEAIIERARAIGGGNVSLGVQRAVEAMRGVGGA